MIKIKFYENGFEVSGHSKPLTCGEVSAMVYIIINSIFVIDKSAGCFLEEGNTGYTALWFDKDNKIADMLFIKFTKDFIEWCEECFEEKEYQITNENRWLEWEEIQKEVEKRGLYFLNEEEKANGLSRSIKAT